MTTHFEEMISVFDRLGRKHNISSIFNDFVSMAICSYHQINIQSCLTVKDSENETRYLEVSNKYGPKELKGFAKIMGLIQLQVYETPYSDPLGEYYMQNISNGKNGEYFTPEPVCQMMAQMQGNQDSIHLKTAFDPACGSGRMLLAFAKLNPDNYFFGSELSNTCAKMAVINFFLNGLRGEVAWMNSLSMEWYGGWQINQNGLGILPIEKEQSRIWSAPPLTERNEKDKGLQLDLF